jgi:hypothetical protein
MNEPAPAGVERVPDRNVRCGTCQRWIEVCAFCERVSCQHPTCHRCIRLALGESIAQPHPHGG